MKKMLVLTILICISSILVPIQDANAYIIDGDVNDWGVNLHSTLAKNKNYLNTNTPHSGVTFFTEDNTDVNTSNYYVGPGYSSGNRYDAEAMYFDSDANYLYLAIISGVSPNESQYPAGDIFIDLGKYQDSNSPNYNTQKYSYGIDISNGSLYSVNSTINTLYYSAANPWKMGSNKILIGDISFVYGNEINSHYVIETAIPISLFGDDLQNGDDIWMHWTMKCGNDILNLKGNATATPEPATLSLLLAGLIGGVGYFRKRIV